MQFSTGVLDEYIAALAALPMLRLVVGWSGPIAPVSWI
jgi:hypothetical protein